MLGVLAQRVTRDVDLRGAGVAARGGLGPDLQALGEGWRISRSGSLKLSNGTLVRNRELAAPLHRLCRLTIQAFGDLLDGRNVARVGSVDQSVRNIRQGMKVGAGSSELHPQGIVAQLALVGGTFGSACHLVLLL